MRLKLTWFHRAPHTFTLTLDGRISKCSACRCVSTSFVYICIRCAIPATITSKAHDEHRLFLCRKNLVGIAMAVIVIWNLDSNVRPALDFNCVILPPKVGHKCDDEHVLMLTYHDDNEYSKSHYCDICEEERDPNHWFYHCEICDTSAHTVCAIDKYPFMKLGSTYEIDNHPGHSLSFVKKKYYYPECLICGKPCQGLALECAESGCNYIVHWECVCPPNLIEHSLWELEWCRWKTGYEGPLLC